MVGLTNPMRSRNPSKMAAAKSMQPKPISGYKGFMGQQGDGSSKTSKPLPKAMTANGSFNTKSNKYSGKMR